jgi:hypothetical protein
MKASRNPTRWVSAQTTRGYDGSVERYLARPETIELVDPAVTTTPDDQRVAFRTRGGEYLLARADELRGVLGIAATLTREVAK